MRYRIIGVETRIENRQQIVVLKNGDMRQNFFPRRYENLLLSPSDLFKSTSLSIEEVELLIGSHVDISYYNKYEKMGNGILCPEEKSMVKDFSIIMNEPINVLRVENSNRLLPFKKIYYTNKYSIDGKEMIRITPFDGEDDEVELFVFKSASGLQEDEFEILSTCTLEPSWGAYYYPTYYQKGEKMACGKTSHTGTEVKSIIIRYYDTYEKMLANSEYANSDEAMERERREAFEESDRIWDEAHDRYMGYRSWEEAAFYEAFEGNIDAWNEHNQ
ncbi:MAG: hypothetical protein H6550_14805 [Chitinophagales bacterium]|nr:hypothetical protein [Chitinophagales bacterium]